MHSCIFVAFLTSDPLITLFLRCSLETLATFSDHWKNVNILTANRFGDKLEQQMLLACLIQPGLMSTAPPVHCEASLSLGLGGCIRYVHMQVWDVSALFEQPVATLLGTELAILT